MSSTQFDKLLVVALRPEWHHLKSSFDFKQDSKNKNLYHIANSKNALLQIGFGLETATKNFWAFLNDHLCNQILHFGSCGALVPELKVGDLFIATTVTNGIDNLPLPATSNRQPETTYGTLYSSPKVLKNRAEKHTAHSTQHAQAVDMESFAIAKLCAKKNIYYLSVRAVFDMLDDNLEAVGEPYDKNGNLNTGKLVVNLIKNPKLILTMPELKRRADVINKRLAEVVNIFIL